MRKLFITTGMLAGFVLSAGLNGCTMFGEKTPPTLKSTTSAEQYERLYWAAVRAKHWTQVPGFLAENVTYRAGGKVLAKDQVLPYLQSLNLVDFTVTDLTVKPNGPDMTVAYTLQLSAGAGQMQTFSVISVWQQVAKGYVLIVHTEQPSS